MLSRCVGLITLDLAVDFHLIPFQLRGDQFRRFYDFARRYGGIPTESGATEKDANQIPRIFLLHAAN